MFGSGRDHFKKKLRNRSRNEFSFGLNQDGRRGGEHGEKRQQSGVGGCLGDTETAVVERRDQRLAERQQIAFPGQLHSTQYKLGGQDCTVGPAPADPPVTIRMPIKASPPTTSPI